MIDQNTLQNWTNIGPQVLSQNTYISLKNALGDVHSRVSNLDYELYLQGSYRNNTNIRGNSDVDVVAQINSTFLSDIDSLSDSQKTVYRSSYPDATYTWNNFRNDVQNALEHYYGLNYVQSGNKSLKFLGNDNLLPADIVVCLQYRKYNYFFSVQESNYIEGICFWNLADQTIIVNYPKLHYENGVNKNSAERTQGNYKPIVRMYKNALVKMIENQILSEGICSSFFIECLLYNVPDSFFKQPLLEVFYSIPGWIVELGYEGINNLYCQNGITKLFGTSATQWSITSLYKFIFGLTELAKR